MSEDSNSQVASNEASVEASDSADMGENYEAQEDGSAVGEKGEGLPAEAAKIKAEQVEKAKGFGKKKLGLKVNGRDQELELDLDNDQELAKYVQKAMAADEKFQEASSMRKQLQQFVHTLKNNPLDILRHPELGLDIKKLAEQVINGEIEEMGKSPEQRERDKLQKELEAAREALKNEQDSKRQAEIARLEEQAFMQLDREIDEALSTAEVPRSSYVIKRLADAMIQATDLGYTEVSVKDVLPFVQKQMEEEMQEMFGKLPEEALERLMGPNLDRVRKKSVAKAKAAQAASKASASQVKESAQSSVPKKQDAGKPAQKIPARKFFSPF